MDKEWRRWIPKQHWLDRDYSLGIPTSDAVLLEIAHERVMVKLRFPDRKRGINEQVRIQQEVQRRLLGLKGERAVARELRVPMNLDVRIRGDKRANLKLPNGIKIDVQTRTIPSAKIKPELLLNVKEKPQPGIALVMVVWMGEQYEPILPGWCWEQEIRERNRIVQYSANKSFAMPMSALRPLVKLRSAQPWQETELVSTPTLF